MAVTTKNEQFDQNFSVEFGVRLSLDVPGRPFSVLIVPNPDTWNDFGFRTQVDILVQLEEQKRFKLSGLLGYVTSESEEPADVRKLEQLLEAESSLTISAGDEQRFFTMLPGLEDYRQLVRDIGPDMAGKLLVAIHDVVALRELKPRSNIPEMASDTKVFQKSFLRKSEAFFAYKNAGTILRGIEAEQFGRMSQDIQIKFQLSGRKNDHQLKFRFDHEADLPKRISVVIGKNGVGKSQALGQIVRAAISGDHKSLSEDDASSRVLMNRLLAFAPTNESASVFPGDRRKNPKVWYKRFSLNRGGRSRRGEGVADTVLQVARSGQYIGERSRWRIFLDSIEAISGWEQIVLLRKDKSDEPIYLSSLRNGRGEDGLLEVFASIDSSKDPVRWVARNTYPLSSGEISFVRFAAQACLYIENGSLLLLDEPETHLHPNFISHFVSILNNMLALTGSAAIIATHSAYFVREVFREQVTVLRVDEEGYVFNDPLRLQTFGADVGAISYFVFGEDESSMLAREVEKRLLRRYQTWEELYADYKDQLSDEILGSLRLSLESGKRDE